MNANTLFLRLEGPMQAWGNHESKFAIRRIYEAPTKSGVSGLLCAALGVSRQQADKEWLAKLRPLRMGVRIDAPGFRMGLSHGRRRLADAHCRRQRQVRGHAHAA